MRVFSVFERELVVVVSCFEFVLCHTNVGPCVTRGCCDGCFVDNVLGKAHTVKRAKVFASTKNIIYKATFNLKNGKRIKQVSDLYYNHYKLVDIH